MKKRRVLIVLGGSWHDFDGFAGSMQPLLESAGWQAEVTYDLERLTRLEMDGFQLVLSYTCFGKPAEGTAAHGAEKMSAAQVAGMAGWVRSGGGLLAAHASTVLGESDPELGALLGGVFVEHPPEFTFSVYPVYGFHPITAGMEAFSVRDELYVERCDPSVNVHMVAVDHGVAHPLVWSKTESRGRVAHVALGHSAQVWELEPYCRLMRQAVGWLAGETA